MECVGFLRGWHHANETVDQMRAHYPQQMQKAMRSAVFHPGMQKVWMDSWRSKAV